MPKLGFGIHEFVGSDERGGKKFVDGQATLGHDGIRRVGQLPEAAQLKSIKFYEKSGDAYSAARVVGSVPKEKRSCCARCSRRSATATPMVRAAMRRTDRMVIGFFISALPRSNAALS
jgi:hypothetical protein